MPGRDAVNSALSASKAGPSKISRKLERARFPSGGRVHEMQGTTSPFAWIATVSHGRRQVTFSPFAAKRSIRDGCQRRTPQSAIPVRALHAASVSRTAWTFP